MREMVYWLSGLLASTEVIEVFILLEMVYIKNNRPFLKQTIKFCG